MDSFKKIGALIREDLEDGAGFTAAQSAALLDAILSLTGLLLAVADGEPAAQTATDRTLADLQRRALTRAVRAPLAPLTPEQTARRLVS